MGLGSEQAAANFFFPLKKPPFGWLLWQFKPRKAMRWENLNNENVVCLLFAFRLPNPPYTPGCDASGIVESVGSGVNTLKIGQRVFVTGRNSGSYAEYIVSESAYVFPLHERLSFAQGWSVGLSGCEVHFLKHLGRTGEAIR